ncbi:MAG: hypothetical protein WC455_18145 [Dehalococcoidia bacterium]
MNLQEGHWYRGKSGKPRYIERIDEYVSCDAVYYHVLGSGRRRWCWDPGFRRWAVDDLGTEEPEGDK